MSYDILTAFYMAMPLLWVLGGWGLWRYHYWCNADHPDVACAKELLSQSESGQISHKEAMDRIYFLILKDYLCPPQLYDLHQEAYRLLGER